MIGEKSGQCKICKKSGHTEWHHIISQHHAMRTGQTSLLHNPDNVIELCRRCHRQTTASMVRKRLTKIHGPLVRTVRKRLTPEEKRAAKLKLKRDREKLVTGSLEKMSDRGVALPRIFVGPRRTMKRFYTRNQKFDDSSEIQIKSLYPPDHWLHSPPDYSPTLSKRFERDWLWTAGGGAMSKARYKPEIIEQLLESRPGISYPRAFRMAWKMSVREGN